MNFGNCLDPCIYCLMSGREHCFHSVNFPCVPFRSILTHSFSCSVRHVSGIILFVYLTSLTQHKTFRFIHIDVSLACSFLLLSCISLYYPSPIVGHLLAFINEDDMNILVYIFKCYHGIFGIILSY